MVEGNLYVVDGRVETAEDVPAEISVWGTSSRAIDAYQAGDTADLGDGETMTSSRTAITGGRATRNSSRAGGSVSS
jgi:hypothetical protein